jgi:hypothetical protein
LLSLRGDSVHWLFLADARRKPQLVPSVTLKSVTLFRYGSLTFHFRTHTRKGFGTEESTFNGILFWKLNLLLPFQREWIDSTNVSTRRGGNGSETRGYFTRRPSG